MAKLFSYTSDTWLGLLFTTKRQSVTFSTVNSSVLVNFSAIQE